VEGIIYYPYIEVNQGPWLIRALLYWDAVATIVPHGYFGGAELETDSITARLLEAELLFKASPDDAEVSSVFRFCAYVDSLNEPELTRRQTAFNSGRTTRIHVSKLSSDVVEVLRSYGLAEQECVDEWVMVETLTAGEFMATLAMAMGHPESYFAQQSNTRWLPGTDRTERLLELLGGNGRLPSSPRELHEARVRLAERKQPLLAVLLGRLFPIPDDYEVDIDELAAFKRDFSPSLSQFRRRVENRVLEILRWDDVDEQIGAVDLIADEYEDEIRSAEDNLRQLRVQRITRSTVIQLARIGDVSGTLDRISKSAEQVAGGTDVVGPLAYAAFARLRLFEGFEGNRSAAIPFFVPPSNQLVDAMGYNSP
jgi:hypothetical protein